MTHPNYVMLYVDNPPASARFYAALLSSDPVETSPTFALFALDTGLMLGLWSKHSVEPAPGAAAGSSEICLKLSDYDAVDTVCADWKQQDIPILLEPKTLDFGRSFVAQDPDGHRLRAFALAPE